MYPYIPTDIQRVLTQALMDSNTYEEMEAEESKVIRKAEDNDEHEVEYGSQVRKIEVDRSREREKKGGDIYRGRLERTERQGSQLRNEGR